MIYTHILNFLLSSITDITMDDAVGKKQKGDVFMVKRVKEIIENKNQEIICVNETSEMIKMDR